MSDIWTDEVMRESSWRYKPSVFKSVVEWIQKAFSKPEPKQEVKPFSRFKQFIENMDQADVLYGNASIAADICDETLRLVRQRMLLADKIKNLQDKITELECYLQLSDEDALQLKSLLERFVSLSKERNNLIYQLTDFDKSLEQMQYLEQQALDAMPSIQDAERYQKIFLHDIGYLEAEKADLIYERGMLKTGLEFLNKFAFVMVVLFGFIALFLGYLNVFNRTPIFLHTSIMVLCAIVVFVVLMVFRNRITYELKLNVKKQQRAVMLLNKKNVLYAYYTNFLKFAYKKYQVRNSQMLAENLKDYKHFVHISSRIDAIRKIMYETESLLEAFLREKGIAYSQFAIEQFAQTANVMDKIAYSRELMDEKVILERNLAELDDKHQRLWEQLETINSMDTTQEHVIGKMIQLYFDEVSRLFVNIDRQEMAG